MAQDPVTFEVNQDGLKVDGVARSVGYQITTAELGNSWRALLSEGKIRRIGQPQRKAFTDGFRFKRYSRISYA